MPGIKCCLNDKLTADTISLPDAMFRAPDYAGGVGGGTLVGAVSSDFPLSARRHRLLFPVTLAFQRVRDVLWMIISGVPAGQASGAQVQVFYVAGLLNIYMWPNSAIPKYSGSFKCHIDNGDCS